MNTSIVGWFLHTIFGVIYIALHGICSWVQEQTKRVGIMLVCFLLDRYSDLQLFINHTLEKSLVIGHRYYKRHADDSPRYIYVFDDCNNDLTYILLAWRLSTSLYTCFRLSRFLQKFGHNSKVVTIIFRYSNGLIYRSVIDIETEKELTTETELSFGDISFDDLKAHSTELNLNR